MIDTMDVTAIEKRLTDLEIKASFTEDLVDSLNQVIVRQQQDIEHLQHRLGMLIEQVESASTASPARNLLDEVPPHY